VRQQWQGYVYILIFFENGANLQSKLV
jgi:hypothetical protein